jgi:hypothetical protein
MGQAVSISFDRYLRKIHPAEEKQPLLNNKDSTAHDVNEKQDREPPQLKGNILRKLAHSSHCKVDY